MVETLEIAGRRVGSGEPCYIIAEVGVNHNGDPELAKRLIVEAKRAGADCVKFQTFKAERLVVKESPKANYQLRTTDPTESQMEMLRKLELGTDDYSELLALCLREKITFLSTPYNVEDVDFLQGLRVEAFKIASAMLVETSFLQYVARKGKPALLSTGMATLAEVDDAVRAFRETGNDQLVLLQCTTDYPASSQDANLRAMQTMQTAFGVPVGYSDHTQSPTACVLAIGLGAKVIEKHFTLDKSLPGPDQSSSADPTEFRQLVTVIREAEAALGNGRKQPTESERANIASMRRSIAARQFIAAGTTITEEMLTFKRPATGIPPRELPQVVGATARVSIGPDRLLEWWMIERPKTSHS